MNELFIIPEETIVNKIYQIRNKKIMLDSDLAELYQVETKRLNEQVKRNLSRFPEDFMFQLSTDEWNNLKSQNATSSWGGRRLSPYAFTEHGILMLSSVLNSNKAIDVNVKLSVFSLKCVRCFLPIKICFLKWRKWKRKSLDRMKKYSRYSITSNSLFGNKQHLERKLVTHLKKGELTHQNMPPQT